jgi:hypothetical protein
MTDKKKINFLNHYVQNKLVKDKFVKDELVKDELVEIKLFDELDEFDKLDKSDELDELVKILDEYENEQMIQYFHEYFELNLKKNMYYQCVKDNYERYVLTELYFTEYKKIIQYLYCKYIEKKLNK